MNMKPIPGGEEFKGDTETLCTICEEPVGRHYIRCDLEEAPYCLKCYRKTDCSKGDHGEECRTDVTVMFPGDD